MTCDYVITVTSRDRVGIIASVSGAIRELDGNIDALSQTVMSGYFTLILTTHFDREVDAEHLRSAILSKGNEKDCGVLVQARSPEAAAQSAVRGEQFVLTITGEDRKGVIQKVTSYLAGRNVNIEDLYARAHNGGFLMVAELDVPSETNVENMQLDLDGLWPDKIVRVTLQHENIFLATNQVDFQH